MKILTPIASYEELEPLLKSGAEELYCGVVPQEWLETYKGVIWLNRRSPAGANLSTVADLKRLVEKAHQARVPVFITLNAPTYTSRQVPYLVELGERLAGEVGVDALIVSDVGLIMALNDARVRLPLHISSLASAINSEAMRFFANCGASRVILPRSLSLAEIEVLRNEVEEEVEFEAFIFNDGCAFEEGFCYTTHHHAVGALCTALIGCGYQFVELRHRTNWEVPEDAMMTHLRDYYDWIWTLNGRGVAFSDAGFPVGPCGLCALSRLQAMGICSVKIVGREAPLWKKLASLKLVKAVLDQVRAGTPREKIILGARKLKGTADLCASGFACYYRDY